MYPVWPQQTMMRAPPCSDSPPMPLLTLRNAELAYGLHPLLDRASFVIEERERVGLIGRNGTGKSSLLKVITGLAQLDDGELARQDGLNVVLVEQEPILPPAETVRDSLVARGKLEEIHDERERWRLDARLSEYLQRLGVASERIPETTSGGE